jgi:hypothetical protein
MLCLPTFEIQGGSIAFALNCCLPGPSLLLEVTFKLLAKLTPKKYLHMCKCVHFKVLFFVFCSRATALVPELFCIKYLPQYLQSSDCRVCRQPKLCKLCFRNTLLGLRKRLVALATQSSMMPGKLARALSIIYMYMHTTLHLQLVLFEISSMLE